MFKKNKHFVFLIIFFLISSIFFITAKVLMIKADQSDTSYRSNNGTTITIDSLMPRLGLPCKIVTNTSGVDYFIPANTADEWNAFKDHRPSNVSLSDCTCNTFIYSDWGNCYNYSHARSLISSGPGGCSGGSPILSEGCSCPGCPAGKNCKLRTFYSNSTTCSGSGPTLYTECSLASVTNTWCTQLNPWYSQSIADGSGCSECPTSPAPIAGCASGNNCVDATAYLGSDTCGGATTILLSVCMPTSYPIGPCVNPGDLMDNASLVLSSASGCWH